MFILKFADEHKRQKMVAVFWLTSQLISEFWLLLLSSLWHILKGD